MFDVPIDTANSPTERLLANLSSHAWTSRDGCQLDNGGPGCPGPLVHMPPAREPAPAQAA